MTFDEIPLLYRHVWSVYEAFRRLGFTDDEVTYLAAPTGLPDGTASKDDYIHLVLNAQDRTFIVVTAPLDRPVEEARALLETLRLGVRDRLVSDETLQRIWSESKMGDVSHFTAFARALIERGFALPALSN